MNPLPAQLLPAVPHLVFGAVDVALPNLVAWALVDGALVLAAVARIPRWFEPADGRGDAEGARGDA